MSDIPCVFCNTDRRWPSSDVVLGAGGRGSCSWLGEEVAHGMDQVEEEPESTRGDLAGDMTVEGGDVPPCRDEALEEVEGEKY